MGQLVDMLGDLKAQSNLRIGEAEKRRGELEATAKDAQTAMKRARLETASGLLSKADDQGCYAGYKSLADGIRNQQSRAAGFVRQADEVVSVHPKDAISLYENAAKVNVEFPGLATKLTFARDAEQRRPKAHTARTAIVMIFVLGALGYGAYYASQHTKQNQ